MIKRLTVFSLFVIFFPGLFAQNLTWDASSFLFPVSTNQHQPFHNTFTFTNTGNDTVKIVDMKHPHDVLVGNYSKGVIPPGGKGFLKATVTPSLIRGKFSRSITVVTDEKENSEYKLTLEGEIRIASDPVADQYPLLMGNLKYKPFYHIFFDLKVTEVRTDTIFIYNASDKEMTLEFNEIPEHLSIKSNSSKLQPNQESIILVTYNAAKRNEFDMVMDQVVLLTNDSFEPEKKLGIIAVIVDDFSNYDDGDYSNAPVATFNTLDYDFGSIRQGYIARYTLELTNTGQDTLRIRKSSANCGCTVGKPEKNNLGPGESTNIQVSFNTFGRRGRQSHTVTFVTNDPRNPSQTFTISGNVE